MEDRYSRQIAFKHFSERDQEKLLDSKIAIIGCGATGTHTAEILVRSGVGNILLVDHDTIELSNLQRQSLYTEKDLGKLKSIVAKEHLRAINSHIRINNFDHKIKDNTIMKLKDYDLIIDCTDHFATRFIINEFCVNYKIPWIFSAVAGSEGMAMLVEPGETPCFSCIFNEKSSKLKASSDGMLGETVATVSSIISVLAKKCLTGKKIEPELITFDIWNQKLEKHMVHKKKSCTVCK